MLPVSSKVVSSKITSSKVIETVVIVVIIVTIVIYCVVNNLLLVVNFVDQMWNMHPDVNTENQTQKLLPSFL
jgi:uncharacterized membrane protein YqhA